MKLIFITLCVLIIGSGALAESSKRAPAKVTMEDVLSDMDKKIISPVAINNVHFGARSKSSIGAVASQLCDMAGMGVVLNHEYVEEFSAFLSVSSYPKGAHYFSLYSAESHYRITSITCGINP